MKIVIALDKFKGSLTAIEASEVVRTALLATRPALTVVCKPMADGGEGTARTLIAARSGQWIPTTVMGPLPEQEVTAGYGWFEQDQSAIVEMAAASGLALVRERQRDPWRATTYGTGQLIHAAAQRGAQRLWLAVGGSATVDGGVGAAMALGWQFLDAAGNSIGLGGGALERLATIIPPAAPGLPAIEVLCDVDNPLCGAQGAAAVYGPQKGAPPPMVRRLDDALRHLADLVATQLGRNILTEPGAGAAGGLAAGALAFLNARLRPGIETLMAATDLESDVANADWVITGEGCFDEQSLRGKVVAGVSRMAARHSVNVAVLAGTVQLAPGQYQPHGIRVAIPARKLGVSLERALAEAPTLLADAAREFAVRFL